MIHSAPFTGLWYINFAFIIKVFLFVEALPLGADSSSCCAPWHFHFRYKYRSLRSVAFLCLFWSSRSFSICLFSHLKSRCMLTPFIFLCLKCASCSFLYIKCAISSLIWIHALRWKPSGSSYTHLWTCIPIHLVGTIIIIFDAIHPIWQSRILTLRKCIVRLIYCWIHWIID